MSEKNWQERVEALEKRHARLRTAVAAATIVVASLAIVASKPARPKAIDASEIRLTDAKGRIRATLTAAGQGPRLTMFSSDGKPHLELYAEEYNLEEAIEGASRGAALVIHGESDAQIRLSAEDHEAGMNLRLLNEPGGAGSFEVGLNSAGGDYAVLRNSEGKELWRAP